MPRACRRGRTDPSRLAGPESCQRLPARVLGSSGARTVGDTAGLSSRKRGTLRASGEGQGRRSICEGDAPAVSATEDGAPLPFTRPHLCLYPSVPTLPLPRTRASPRGRTPRERSRLSSNHRAGIRVGVAASPNHSAGSGGRTPAVGSGQRPDAFSQTARWLRRRPGGDGADRRLHRA